MAPFPVDPSGGDGRACARLGAGGTPALPGSLHPMTSSHQGHQIAEAFWCRLWLREVHLSSDLFVFIGVHSWFIFINERSAGRGPGSRNREFCTWARMIRTAPPGRHPLGARASRPHPLPLAAAELLRCCRQPPCGQAPHRPGRRTAMAPFPVDPSGGDGRGRARLCAGGTPALPGNSQCG